jgi:hypothetical protein
VAVLAYLAKYQSNIKYIRFPFLVPSYESNALTILEDIFMSQLRIRNNMLEYKGTEYNISRINEMNLFEIKGKRFVSFKFLKYTMPISAILIWISYVLFFNKNFFGISSNYYIIYGLLTGAIGLFLLIFSIKKSYLLIKKKTYSLCGLSLMIGNSTPVFIWL